MQKGMTAALLALVAHALTASAQDQTKPGAGKVSVRLSFSVEEYDPRAPSTATLKCVVRNDTDRAVEVPVGYDGRSVILKSGLLTLHKAAAKGQPGVKRVRVGPGREQVVFELPLDDILRRGKGTGGSWRWDWPRRPEPPRSPIHKYRQPGFLDRAIQSLNLPGISVPS